MKLTSTRFMKLAGAILLMVLASHPLSGQEPIDVSQRGPQVGERIPDFSLVDQEGRTWNQDSILGENGTMLVFVRSADW